MGFLLRRASNIPITAWSIDSYSVFRYHDEVIWEVVRMLLKKAIQHL